MSDPIFLCGGCGEKLRCVETDVPTRLIGIENGFAIRESGPSTFVLAGHVCPGGSGVVAYQPPEPEPEPMRGSWTTSSAVASTPLTISIDLTRGTDAL